MSFKQNSKLISIFEYFSLFVSLWANTPKEVIEYADYTFYDHFGCLLPSFLPRAVIYDYLTGRAKANNLRRFIRFNTAVRYVDFDDVKNEFSVDVEDLNTGSIQCLTFDRVIVSVGHYNVPNMTNIDGVDQFPGRVLHSHEFRGADEFAGLSLLIIGGSVSAEDIALQCYKFGARSVTISSRHEPIGFKWPAEIKDAPMIVRMEGRTAHFKDGSTVDNIDAIIFCTGYRHSYPFMADQLRLKCDVTEFIPPGLYKSIFSIDQPYLAYLGSTRYIYSFPMFDMQTALVRDVFLDHVKLPDKDQMQTDANKWKAREKAMVPINILTMIDFETDYMRDLLALVQTHDDNLSLSKFDFDKAKNLAKKYLENKFADVVNYRDIQYESVIDTGNTKLVQVCKPWLENMDDSMESFLINYREKINQ
jgi:trimethylamine monooxygenase